MMNILIIGGSGFIGTNLIEALANQSEINILNLDIAEPKLSQHLSFWKAVDIRNKKELEHAVNEFEPSIVIQLAAKTDLKGKRIEEYNSNIEGIENILSVLNTCQSVKRVIFTSSMYVCKPGYSPVNISDYCPHTIYGQSKVLTEKAIFNANPQNYSWCIIRPTSIWGPWFGEPYKDFFNVVLSKRYFHLGKKACSKTYGYIDNTIFQIKELMYALESDVNRKVFYLGDWPAYNISEWADEIAFISGFKIQRIPFILFKALAWTGDILSLAGIKFPMTSFRLKNMTTDNIHDLSPIMKISPVLPKTRKEGIIATINWLEKQRQK